MMHTQVSALSQTFHAEFTIAEKYKRRAEPKLHHYFRLSFKLLLAVPSPAHPIQLIHAASCKCYHGVFIRLYDDIQKP